MRACWKKTAEQLKKTVERLKKVLRLRKPRNNQAFFQTATPKQCFGVRLYFTGNPAII